MVYGGPIFWDLKDAPTIMQWYREFQASAPDEFYVFLGLQTVPSGDPFPKDHWGKKICVLLVSHNGTAADGEKAVNAIRAALPSRSSILLARFLTLHCRACLTALYPKACSGTGRVTS